MRIVRTKTLLLVFLLTLTFFAPGFVASNVEGGTSDIPPSQPPRASINAEQDNVDSWNVHPGSGRWTEVFTEIAGEPSITEGLLNITATGTGSGRSERWERGLRKLDGKITIRFKFTSETGASSDDRVVFSLSSTTATFGSLFRIDTASSGIFTTKLIAEDTLTLTGSERVRSGIWYKLEIKYDQLESELNWKLVFDNGTGVFDHNILDVTAQRPEFFTGESTFFLMDISSLGSNIDIEFLMDFINAPFKENEWVQTDVPGDADYLQDSWHIGFTQDDIDDSSTWELVVPFLDSVSGIMSIDSNAIGSMAAGDVAQFDFFVYGVDVDDGDKHLVLNVRLALLNTGTATSEVFVFDGNGVIDSIQLLGSATAWPRASFSISVQKDRSRMDVKVRGWPAGSTTGTFKDMAASVNVADFTDSDGAQEFVLETFYQFDFDSNIEMTSIFEDFGFTERDIFADIVNAVVEPIGNFLQQLFVAAFRFLATIFTIVGDLITLAFDIIIAALEVALVAALGLIETAIGTLETALEVALGLVEVAIEALEPFLTVISDAVDALWTLFIATLDDIVTALIALASDFTDFFFDVLELLIPLIITFLGTILGSIVGFLADLLFLLWDALGLPNLLALLDLTVTHSVNFISELVAALTDVVQFLIDISWIALVVWWAICVPVAFARANFEPLAGLGNAVQVYFQNSTPISILGFQLYVPQGLIATVWLIVLLPADFVVFTAL